MHREIPVRYGCWQIKPCVISVCLTFTSYMKFPTPISLCAGIVIAAATPFLPLVIPSAVFEVMFIRGFHVQVFKHVDRLSQGTWTAARSLSTGMAMSIVMSCCRRGPQAASCVAISNACEHVAIRHTHGFAALVPAGRPRLVILGTGWRAARLLRDIDPNFYDITVCTGKYA